jgi:MFS family permease
MQPGRVKQPLPRGVWAIGLVSLLMDSSSEMIHALLPVFLVGTLGASALAVGVIEGIAEATALLMKVVSGVVSDWTGRRKVLAVAGYGLSALTKPMFALAATPAAVLTARFADRIGKGIRGAPRDALVADITPPNQRGRAYGLRQGLDTVGAVAGPLVAAGLMLLWNDNIRAVFWFACIPAAAAVAVLVLGVREPPRPADHRAQFPIRRDSLRRLPGLFWAVTGVAAVFSLARFSEAFLLLRGSDLGMAFAAVPLIMVVMNLVAAAVSYPAGAAMDAGRRFSLLIAGVLALLAAQAVLGWASAPAAVLVGAALWGLHLGLTQGLLAAVVSLTAPGSLRGTAFGLFHVVSGIMLLAGSVLAGVLWTEVGPSATFVVGAGFAAATLAALIALRPLLRLSATQ